MDVKTEYALLTGMLHAMRYYHINEEEVKNLIFERMNHIWETIGSDEMQKLWNQSSQTSVLHEMFPLVEEKE